MKAKKKAVSVAPKDQVKDATLLYVPPPKEGSIQVGVRLAPDMMQRVQEIVQSGATPFKTHSDLVRSAIHYFMEKEITHRMGARFERDVKLASSEIRRAQLDLRVLTIKELVASNAKLLKEYLALGLDTHAFTLLGEMAHSIEQIYSDDRAMLKAALRLSDTNEHVRSAKMRYSMTFDEADPLTDLEKKYK